MKKLFILLCLIPLNVNAFSSSATSTIIMDQESRRIIYANNVNEIRSIASISKIMTAIIAIESNKLDQKVVVGDEIDVQVPDGISKIKILEIRR